MQQEYKEAMEKIGYKEKKYLATAIKSEYLPM